MDYDEIAKHFEILGYRDKLRLSQLLIQLARKEEDQEIIIDKLEKKKFLKIESNNRVTYL